MTLENSFEKFGISLDRAAELYVEFVVFAGKSFKERSKISTVEILDWIEKNSSTKYEYGFLCIVFGRSAERHECLKSLPAGSQSLFTASAGISEGRSEEELRILLRNKIKLSHEHREEEEENLDSNFW